MDSQEQQSEAPLTAQETERLRKKIYYENHREKIQAKRKEKGYEDGIKICKDRDIPDELTDCLYKHIKTRTARKYKKDLLSLHFDHTADLLFFLNNVMYKTQDINQEEFATLLTKYQHIKERNDAIKNE